MAGTSSRDVTLRQDGFIRLTLHRVDLFYLAPDERNLIAGITDLLDDYERKRQAADGNGTAVKETGGSV